LAICEPDSIKRSGRLLPNLLEVNREIWQHQTLWRSRFAHENGALNPGGLEISGNILLPTVYAPVSGQTRVGERGSIFSCKDALAAIATGED
jgi:hypothetical protein